MGECTPLACALWLCVFSTFIPLSHQNVCAKALRGKSYVKKQKKGICWHPSKQSQRPRSSHSHMLTQCFVRRQTLGSGLGFIREMHSIAISGKHILPCTYPLIALLLHKGKIDLMPCTFSISKVSGSVTMCPRGTVCEADNLTREKVRFEFINN